MSSDFRALSPLDFEDLVRDLLQEELGVRFESFGPGADLGIDFRFSKSGKDLIVQAKHYPDSRSSELLRILKSEDIKVAKLHPGRYILATSRSISPSFKSKIVAAMPSSPLTTTDILGKEDLTNLLSRHPKIERKHFKLWLTSSAVLDRILHSGVYNRTDTEMALIRNLVPRFVYNSSVPQSEEILSKHGTLIITGVPGIGKSTLARMLLWLHAEQDWQIAVIDDIKEAFEISNEGQKRLIFFDDFLGQVRLSTDLIRGIDQRFPPFFQRVRDNKDLRFILTTREYILRQAQAQSGRLSSAEINASQFILDVGSYTRAAKAKMLYNHIYFSNFSREERDSLIKDDFFLKIINHRNFNPRLIQLLTSTDYLSLVGRPLRETVTTALDNPQELWEKPYRTHISSEGRALLLSLFFNGNDVPIARLERGFKRFAHAMEIQIPQYEFPVKFRATLRELEGSMLSIQERSVRFGNPGIRDYLERAILDDRFLETAIDTVAEFYEIRRAWAFFVEYNHTYLSTPDAGAAWARAMTRLRQANSAGALHYLSLAIKMFDALQSEELLETVAVALDDLDQSEVDGTDVDICKEVLEQVAMTLLPMVTVGRAKKVVSQSARTILSIYGDALSIDEIKSLGSALHDYGDDQVGSGVAMRLAIDEFLDEIDFHLVEVSGLSELDSFETELQDLMSTYGVAKNWVTSKIEERRETIEVREEQADHDYYSSGGPSSIGDLSDAAIISMFQGLSHE